MSDQRPGPTPIPEIRSRLVDDTGTEFILLRITYRPNSMSLDLIPASIFEQRYIHD